MGDPSTATGYDRNLIWRAFTGASTRVRASGGDADDFEINAVADLRRTTAAHPEDVRLHRLVGDLRQAGPRFAALWTEHLVTTTGSSRKTIDHPRPGPITLDCDVLTVAGCDLRLVVYTTEPSGSDADRLRLTQTAQRLPDRCVASPGTPRAEGTLPDDARILLG
jgi:MmyB-like transcription regulator ligand binding domain